MPLPSLADDKNMPQNLEEISEQMKKRYLTNDHWWAT